jgi:hypothetical protein
MNRTAIAGFVVFFFMIVISWEGNGSQKRERELRKAISSQQDTCRAYLKNPDLKSVLWQEQLRLMTLKDKHDDLIKNPPSSLFLYHVQEIKLDSTLIPKL